MSRESWRNWILAVGILGTVKGGHRLLQHWNRPETPAAQQDVQRELAEKEKELQEAEKRLEALKSRTPQPESE